MTRLQKLAAKMLEIQSADNRQDYISRNHYIIEAIALALDCGIEAGLRIDPSEPEWPVAFIELPTGQTSWHIPQHGHPWDNHTTEEKRLRMFEFCATVLAELDSG